MSSAARVVAGRYELGRLLGRGGMGEVYEARHLPSGTRVALKVLRAVTGAGDDSSTATTERDASDAARRFEREAQAVAAIRSPHVVQVFDGGCDGATGERFMAMDLLVGEDVAALLRRSGPLPFELVLKIGAQACAALAQAHAVGVVHRDIKPANLFLARVGADRAIVKVVDFGIARVRSADAHSLAEMTQDLTRTGSMLGSPTYMSPEQARGSKDVDPRSDVWSLGVVLYKLLCGHAPHEAADIGIGELLIAICTTPPPPLQSRAPWVPPEVALAIHHALQIDRAHRFPSAEDMGRALVALLPPSTNPFELGISELHGIDERARSHVAPRADVAETRAEPRGGYGQMSTEAGLVSAAGPAPSMSPSPSVSARPGAAPAPVPIAGPARMPRFLWLKIIALVLTLLVASSAGVWFWEVSHQMPTGDQQKDQEADTQKRIAALQAETDRRTAEIQKKAYDAHRHAYPLPKGATITIDGTPASPAADGQVDMPGNVGDFHTLNVTRGASVQTLKVLTTDVGLLEDEPERRIFPQTR